MFKALFAIVVGLLIAGPVGAMIALLLVIVVSISAKKAGA